MSRPLKGRTPIKTVVTVRLRPGAKAAAEKKAAALGVSLSEYIRELVEKDVK